MDKKTLRTIKGKLLQQKKDLEERLGDLTQKDLNKPDNYLARFPDYGDKEDENAIEVATYSDRLSLEYQTEKELQDVKAALANLEKGTYGICKYCHRPIEIKRLLIRPTSSSCPACKKRLKGES